MILILRWGASAACVALILSPSFNPLHAQPAEPPNLLTLAHAPQTPFEIDGTNFVVDDTATPNERVHLLLASAESSFKKNLIDEAEKSLTQAAALRPILSLASQQMVDIFLARLDIAKGDYDEAAATLAPWSNRPKETPFFSIVARLHFRALVQGSIPEQAYDYLKRYRSVLTSSLSSSTTADLLALLEKLDARRNAEAVSLISSLLLGDFPISWSSRQAFARLSNAECVDDFVRKDTLQNLDVREKIAKRLVRDYGIRPDLRRLGLALMRISEDSPVPSVPVDALSLEKKSELLNQAELLLAAWEYESSLKILLYLADAAEYDEKEFKRDRLLLALGRTLNQLERYEEAAGVYTELVTDFAATRSARIARERLLLSLHYARRFDEEIAWIKKFQKRHPSVGDRWGLFWAQYLNKNDSDALKSGRNILSVAMKRRNSSLRSRATYWLARLQERSGAFEEAKKHYESLAENSPSSHYSILARWRLMVSQNGVKSDSTAVPIATASVPGLTPAQDEPVDISSVQEELAAPVRLAQLGLSEFSQLLFGFSLPKRATREETAQRSLLAKAAHRYKLAITMVDPSVSEHLAKGFTEKELQRNLADFRQIWTVSYPRPYPEVVEPTAKILGMGEGLIYSIIRTESLFNPDAVSSVGALGLMQIMPRTGMHIARLLGDTEHTTPQLSEENLNIVYGSWYLRRLIRYYQGNYLLAAAAYNAGPLAVDRWIRQHPSLELDEFLENIPYDQTRAYVPKILNYMNLYSRLYGEKKQPIDIVLPKALPTPESGLPIF